MLKQNIMNDGLLNRKFVNGGDVSEFYSSTENSLARPGPKTRKRRAKRARRKSRRKSGGAKWLKGGCGR